MKKFSPTELRIIFDGIYAGHKITTIKKHIDGATDTPRPLSSIRAKTNILRSRLIKFSPEKYKK